MVWNSENPFHYSRPTSLDGRHSESCFHYRIASRLKRWGNGLNGEK